MRIFTWFKKNASLLLLTGLVFALLYGLEDWEILHSARTEVQKRSIPDSMLRLGKTGKVARLFEYKRRIGFDLEGIDKGLAPEEFPSSTIIDSAAIAAGLSVVSIVIQPEDLYHPESGLIANPFKRGMRWERPAYMSYFENGKLLFATGLGLRVHGGKSRKLSKKSFRFLLRNIYGAEQFAPGILFKGRGDPIRSLILHNDLRTLVRNGEVQHWRFMNPLAYDIARQIGALAPETKTVQFYLNGEYQYPYVLTEHLSKNYLTAYFGHDDFIFSRTRRDKGSKVFKMGNRQIYEEFLTWPRRAEFPFTMQKAATKIDVENLSRWFISILYCGTTDPFQGSLLLDESRPDAKWFWINWDMDHSFMDFYYKAKNPWEIDIFDVVLNNGRQWGKPRAIILSRLLNESPEYWEYFKELFTNVMNHRLTRSFLESKIDQYEREAIVFGVEDRRFIADLREYVKHRQGVLREQMKIYFDTGPSYQFRIRNTRPVQFEVDGYPIQTEYEGWYFKSMTVTVKVLGEERESFSHWLVNGQRIRTDKAALEVIVEGDTVIEPVFSKA